MNVHLLMVTKNEAHKYLQANLLWHRPHFASMFVYDDRSTDNTVAVAAEQGAGVMVRPESEPSFMENEGAFRENALRSFELVTDLTEGDWIFVVDADEFVVGLQGVKASLQGAISAAVERSAKSVLMPRPEVWAARSMGGILVDPLVRSDGLWKGVCTRLYRWEPGGHIKDKAMGCGNEPTYVKYATISNHSNGLQLLHLGYANGIDLQEKYDRYSGLEFHGHNEAHIQSIIREPTLVTWQGPWPTVWRGAQ